MVQSALSSATKRAISPKIQESRAMHIKCFEGIPMLHNSMALSHPILRRMEATMVQINASLRERPCLFGLVAII